MTARAITAATIDCDGLGRSPAPILEITSLAASYHAGRPVISGIDLRLSAGELVGIVGESGGGKSTLLTSILGFSHDGLVVDAGRISYCGVDITHLRWAERRRLLGPEMGMVFQRPSASFDPLVRIGSQFTESVRLHTPKASHAACREAARRLLRRLRFEDPDTVLDAYPFQLSGGMAQRTALALALISEPRLLLADEPTSALDVRSQREVVDLLGEVATDLGTSVMFVSHQIGLVRRLVSQVHILAGGVFVESGPTEKVLLHPEHPDTRRLLAAIPILEGCHA